VAVAALAVACGGGGTKAPVKPAEPVALPIAGLATLDGDWHATDVDGWGYDLTIKAGTFNQTIQRTTGSLGPCTQKGTLQDYQQAYGSPYVSPEEQRAMYGGDPYAGQAAAPPAGTRLALVMTYENNACNPDYQGGQMVMLASEYDGDRVTLRTASGWGGAEESHRYERVVAPVTAAPRK